MSSLLGESPKPKRQFPQWQNGFVIDGVAGGPIRLEQVDGKTFELKSRIEYCGDTGLGGVGLDPDVLETIKTLDPALQEGQEFLTDLASVPGPTRWFLGAYGEHTPAVVIHDWLIPTPEGLDGMTDAYADRYMRFMLKEAGIRWLKRWVMWAAVTLRTRLAAGGGRRLSMIVWIVAAIVGMGMFVTWLLNGGTGWLIVSVTLPFLAAFLWGKQYGAGIIGAIAAPWLLPPTVLAAFGYGIYFLIEWTRAWMVKHLRGREPETGTYMPEGV